MKKIILTCYNKVRKIVLFPFLFFGIFGAITPVPAETLLNRVVLNYFPIFIPVLDEEGDLYIAIRSYEMDSKHYFLIVNPNTLKTYQRASSELRYRYQEGNGNGYIKEIQVSNTPYYKALAKYNDSSSSENEETQTILSHGEENNGIFLTIDMCPSAKKFEKDFFESLLKYAENKSNPIPLAICISGLWLLQHEQELNWLANQDLFNITWVNHSFSHLYYSDVSDLQKNFLKLPRTNTDQEILYLEQMLIARGITPSVFFRYPGLVYDERLLKLTHYMGLIPLGSDCWIAKGQVPKLGSIILLHGNSNEHEGIKLFMQWNKKNKYPFLPLYKAVIP